ncbi:MAG: zinc-dependent metalloprotease [Acidimicrobiia bacterium]|nr:zinc-dependent metalloprotease [Acidimicrobiia bacterium]
MSNVRWPLAISVAKRFAGTYPLAGTYHETRFARQAPELVARAGEMVEAETGLRGPGQPDVAVVSREEWIEANLASMAVLAEPLEERLESQSGFGPRIAGSVMGAEIGAVMGFLAKRVLGQYELVLPSEERGFGDTVMFVGANVLWMERQFEFRPDEFRFWVALHECTHRLQFVGVPWLRDYFMSLVKDLVGSTQPEPGRVRRITSEARAAAAEGRPIVDERGLFGLFATPDQVAVVDRVQALMSLLEGHGHVVMDRIGARELVGQARMSAMLKARRQDPRTAGLFRLIGLEMKMRQYDLGARFIDGVEELAGWEAVSHAWTSPDHLPTLAEIEDPRAWLTRVA